MEIRIMTPADIPNVASLEIECFSTPWSAHALEMELQNRCALFFVAYRDAELLGYIGMHAVMDEGYIANIAVSPAHRRDGVATALLCTLVREGEQRRLGFLTLEVRKSNTPAIAFYEKNGFGVVGQRKNFYSSPAEDALLMTYFFGNKEDSHENSGH